MAVLRIDRGEDFDREYPRVRQWLLDALVLSTNPDEERLLQGLADRSLILWVGERGAAVTTITLWDNQLTLWFVLAGGDLTEILAGIPEVEAYAAERGCTATLIGGRDGWERVMKPYGYRKISVMLMKEIDGKST